MSCAFPTHPAAVDVTRAPHILHKASNSLELLGRSVYLNTITFQALRPSARILPSRTKDLGWGGSFPPVFLSSDLPTFRPSDRRCLADAVCRRWIVCTPRCAQDDLPCQPPDCQGPFRATVTVARNRGSGGGEFAICSTLLTYHKTPVRLLFHK